MIWYLENYGWFIQLFIVLWVFQSAAYLIVVNISYLHNVSSS